MNARKIKIGHIYRFKNGSQRFTFIGFQPGNERGEIYVFKFVDSEGGFNLSTVRYIKECL